MTSRQTTPLRALAHDSGFALPATGLSDMLYRLAFGAIGWPWLLYSLWGGTKADKRRLLSRVGLEDDALPHLGSWKADTGFLHRIVDAVEELQPATVVELGAGASSLVCARALQLNGGGRLYSYDQHGAFAHSVEEWLHEEGASAHVSHAPLGAQVPGWPGGWYRLDHVPEQIDLLIIDGPPWSVHPYVRGAAECLFDRLSPGAIVLLDDGARPGERVVASRWRKRWPQIDFQLVAGSTKGTLVGRKASSATILPFPQRKPQRRSHWRRAAAMLALMATGWIGNDVLGGLSEPAHASTIVDEADASFSASLTRQRMASQVETSHLDRTEIRRTTGIDLPALPPAWRVTDVQVYPSDLGTALALVAVTGDGQLVSLFATRAETPAEKLPLLEKRDRRSVAYWEVGPFAYALTGELSPDTVLSLAAEVAAP
ncbi:class I SAM-dependent methyltransferase [Alteraurantiacibacter aquimixticola]|uniref:Class I SAM-dependent methyltransferase n=1 Tax=Alteraurantiacibacter aquimixticola TaxID=2489173 RepID=A0A4T3F3H6_9SPHN|nr:class I SAM-dependent methyltransferase [Alteraurantiacibacter aquimixticola]TIX51805.1 class I SAM-dependent methyltransferase [Alteraurantiacibacter aquimixticola]